MPETINSTFEIVPERSEKPTNPFISFLHNFRLPFPFPGFRLPFPFPGAPQSDSKKPKADDTSDTATNTPASVRFPYTRQFNSPPLRIEYDESAQSAPAWQVYALGGYLLAIWIWGKWKDRQKQNKDQSFDENMPPPSN